MCLQLRVQESKCKEQYKKQMRKQERKKTNCKKTGKGTGLLREYTEVWKKGSMNPRMLGSKCNKENYSKTSESGSNKSIKQRFMLGSEQAEINT